MKIYFLKMILACWVATTASATTWNYVPYYPWTFSFEDGWFYQQPVQKVWQGGDWILSPMGDPFDINRIFDAPLASLGGTNGSGHYFRLTISSDFPRLGLLSVGGKTLQRVDPVAVTPNDAEAVRFLDPIDLDTRPYPDHEVYYDAHYLVEVRKLTDDIVGRSTIYFESLRPFLTWADRASVHGVVHFNFTSATKGKFTLMGSLDGDAGLDAFRGPFRSVVYDLTPPPLDPPLVP